MYIKLFIHFRYFINKYIIAKRINFYINIRETIINILLNILSILYFTFTFYCVSQHDNMLLKTINIPRK